MIHRLTVKSAEFSDQAFALGSPGKCIQVVLPGLVNIHPEWIMGTTLKMKIMREESLRTMQEARLGIVLNCWLNTQ